MQPLHLLYVTACDYVPLKPVPAGLLKPEEPLES
jgi:hypothetical protein